MEDDVTELKRRLRKEAAERRDHLSGEEIEIKSRMIRDRLFGLDEFRNANGAMFYSSMRSEVVTREMIEHALALGNRVAVPVTKFNPKRLEPSWIDGWDQLVPGKFGVPEPPESIFRTAPLEEIELVVVPGLAFDLDGHRLGYGAGFYDRFLSLMKHMYPLPAFIAVAYELQIVDRLPSDRFDVPVDTIVTEDRVIEIVAGDRR